MPCEEHGTDGGGDGAGAGTDGGPAQSLLHFADFVAEVVDGNRAVTWLICGNGLSPPAHYEEGRQ